MSFPSDEELMQRALSVARLSGEDVPIGAVIVDETGHEIARAHNEREKNQDPTAHAEVLAVRHASRTLGQWRLLGCTLAVTLEPCAMCAGALVLARIKRVVYGARDPKGGATHSLWEIPQDTRLNHRVEVRDGVCVDECSALLKEFFAHRRRAARKLRGSLS